MNSLRNFVPLLAIAFALPLFFLIVIPFGKLSKMDTIQFEDENGTKQVFPPSRTNLQGSKVYAANGCAYCHTQMVRPTYAGTDMWRDGWNGRGEEGFGRETLPQDYLGESYAHLGMQRHGPDLSNVGYRRDDAQWHYEHLFDPRSKSEHSNMPAFRNLFDKQELSGQASDNAVKIEEIEGVTYQWVPNGDATRLVGYLLSMKKDAPEPATESVVATK